MLDQLLFRRGRPRLLPRVCNFLCVRLRGAGLGCAGAAVLACALVAPAQAKTAPAKTARSRSASVKKAPARAASPKPLGTSQWLSGVELTQYWPVPESWFTGELVPAPGLSGLYPIDFLYSARGLSMQGSGIIANGQIVHIDALGQGGWVTASGHAANFSSSPPYWRAGGYWRNAQNGVTYPLQTGGWSDGVGKKYVALPGVSFAAGASKPLTYWESVAVDPKLIPLGSWIYIPAYLNTPGHGWFLAQDTGGAIVGHHLDIYRPPPASPTDPGTTLFSQQVYVVPPKQQASSSVPGAAPSAPAPASAPPSSAPSGTTGATGVTPPLTSIAPGASSSAATAAAGQSVAGGVADVADGLGGGAVAP